MKSHLKNPEYTRFAALKFRPFQKARRDLQFGFTYLLLFLAAAIPVRVSQWIGRGMGFVLFPLLRRDRAICEYQLEMVFPEMDGRARRKLALRSMQNLGMTLMEMLTIPRMRRHPERWVQLEGEQALLQAHAQGRGVIFVTGHMANWELLSLVFDRLRIPAQAFVASIANTRLNDLIIRHRRSPFMRIVQRGAGDGPRQLLNCLKSGDVLFVLMDHDTKVQGVFVNFFGKPAHTPRVAASLALRGGVPVVSGFGRRRADGSHLFRFERHTPPEGAVNDAEGVRRFTQQLSDAMEAHIRACPEQWTWNHRRWKTLPQNSDEPPAKAVAKSVAKSAAGSSAGSSS